MDGVNEFAVYENIGATPEHYIKNMSKWAFELESEGRLPQKWCIQDNRIQVIGNADLRGRTIDYPFGVVAGFFYCDDKDKSSPNYPTHIGYKSIY